MNFKTTILLLLTLCVAGVVAVGAVLWGGVTPSPTDKADDPERMEAESPLLPGVRASQVARVEIERPVVEAAVSRSNASSGRLAWERAGVAWRQVEPVEFPAQTAALDEFINRASRLRSIDRFEPRQDGRPSREEAGVAPALATRVTLIDRGGSRETLLLGTAFLAGRAYAAAEGDERVSIVPLSLHDRLPAGNGEAWRARTLDIPEASSLDLIEIIKQDTAGEELTIKLTRAGSHWLLNDSDGDGSTTRADAAAVDRLVATLAGMNIAEFISDDPEALTRTGLDRPRVTVELVPAAAPPIAPTTTTPTSAGPTGQASSGSTSSRTLRIGDLVPGRSVLHATFSVGEAGDAARPPVFTLPADAVDVLPLERTSLLAWRVFDIEPQEVAGVRVERAEGEDFTLERSPSGWRFAAVRGSTPGYEVDPELASAMALSLASMRAVVVGDGEAAPEGEPLARVTLTGLGGGEGEAAAVYEGDEAEVVRVVRSGQPAVVYKVPRAEAAGVLGPAVGLRDRVILDLPRQSAEYVLMTLRGRSVALQNIDAHWVIAGDGEADAPTVAALLRSLSPLRAGRWVAVPEGADFTGGRLEVMWTDRDDSGPIVIDVDASRGLGRLAGDESGAAFELPREVLELMAAEFRPRTVVAEATGSIRSITRTHADRETTLRRDPVGRYVTDLGAAVDQRAAAKLFDTLAGLRVERFIDPPADLGDAVAELRVLGEAGTVHRLVLYPEGVAAMGDRWFTLPAGAYEILNAEVPLSP